MSSNRDGNNSDEDPLRDQFRQMLDDRNGSSSDPDSDSDSSDQMRRQFEQLLESSGLETLEEMASKVEKTRGQRDDTNRGADQSDSDSSSEPRKADLELFFNAVADADPLDGDRRHTSEPDPDRDLEARRDDASPELITPGLPKEGPGLRYIESLHQNHRDLLDRHESYRHSNTVPELNLRGDRKPEARQRLQQFVFMNARQPIRFARIITGRGLRSNPEPVLKPVVLQWLEGPGAEHIRGYAPELTEAKDYGSLLIEFRQ